jgi:hypothetical protein
MVLGGMGASGGEDSSLPSSTREGHSVSGGIVAYAAPGTDEEMWDHDDAMQEMLQMMGDPRLGPAVKQSLKSFGDSLENRGMVDAVFNEVERERANEERKLENERQRLRLKGKNVDVRRAEDDFDKFEDPDIGGALRMIAGTQEDLGMRGMDPSAVESEGEETMRRMIEEFEGLGERADYDEVSVVTETRVIFIHYDSCIVSPVVLKVIDNMMRQLLAKDVMYDPIVKICGLFPKWLAENKYKKNM